MSKRRCKMARRHHKGRPKKLGVQEPVGRKRQRPAKENLTPVTLRFAREIQGAKTDQKLDEIAIRLRNNVQLSQGKRKKLAKEWALLVEVGRRKRRELQHQCF